MYNPIASEIAMKITTGQNITVMELCLKKNGKRHNKGQSHYAVQPL